MRNPKQCRLSRRPGRREILTPAAIRETTSTTASTLSNDVSVSVKCSTPKISEPAFSANVDRVIVAASVATGNAVVTSLSGFTKVRFAGAPGIVFDATGVTAVPVITTDTAAFKVVAVDTFAREGAACSVPVVVVAVTATVDAIVTVVAGVNADATAGGVAATLALDVAASPAAVVVTAVAVFGQKPA